MRLFKKIFSTITIFCIVSLMIIWALGIYLIIPLALVLLISGASFNSDIFIWAFTISSAGCLLFSPFLAYKIWKSETVKDLINSSKSLGPFLTEALFVSGARFVIESNGS